MVMALRELYTTSERLLRFTEVIAENLDKLDPPDKRTDPNKAPIAYAEMTKEYGRQLHPHLEALKHWLSADQDEVLEIARGQKLNNVQWGKETLEAIKRP